MDPGRGPSGARSGRARSRPRPRCSPTWGSATKAISRAAASSTCRRLRAIRRRPNLERAKAALLERPRRTGPPGPRRQAPLRLERAHDGRLAGRDRRGARRATLPRRRARVRRVHPDRRCATPTAGCCATYNGGEARLNAYLEDHAYLLEALIALYEATFEPRWFEAAQQIAATMIERFGDPENGGFFTTSDDHEELIARRKDLDDHPAPSGNSAAANGLLRLAALTGEAAYESSGPRRPAAARRARPQAPAGPGLPALPRSTSTSPPPARSR